MRRYTHTIINVRLHTIVMRVIMISPPTHELMMNTKGLWRKYSSELCCSEWKRRSCKSDSSSGKEARLWHRPPKHERFDSTAPCVPKRSSIHCSHTRPRRRGFAKYSGSRQLHDCSWTDAKEQGLFGIRFDVPLPCFAKEELLPTAATGKRDQDFEWLSIWVWVYF